MSECLRNGRLPLWNPYQHCGYPFLADPQSLACYPLAILICLLAKYTIYTLSLELILIIFIGSTGIYHLIRFFSPEAEPAFFGAMCFAACGFFVSNAEHLNWLTSAAWITWLLWAYLRMQQTLKYGYALLSAIFLFMLLSGGYIAFFIITCYILAALFVVELVQKRAKAARVLLIKNNGLFAIAFLLLAGGCIYSYAGLAQVITRGNGLSLAKANSLPFSPQCSLSFLIPFASIKNDGLYLTDISMRNAYFGIIGFVLMITGLLLPKSRRLWAVIIISLLCLLVSFGPYMPLRKWLYEYMPLMNMFRFPALFRIFFIIGFIIIASRGFQQIILSPAKYASRLTAIIVALLLLLVGISGYELHKYGLSGNYKHLFSGISKFIEQSLFYQHVLIQCAIQTAFLLVFLFIVQFKKSRYLTARNLLLLCALDLFMATQLNMYGTVVDTIASREVYKKAQNLPGGFPVPDDSKPMLFNNTNAYKEEMSPLVSNLGIFKKEVATDGYNPFILSNFNKLNESAVKDSVWANPYLYFSYSIDTGNSLPSHTASMVDAEVYNRIKNIPLMRGVNDKIHVVSFKPGRIVATTYTEHPTILVLQQSSYPGWRVTVDNEERPYFETAYSNISLVLQQGVHNVVFSFEPAYVRFLFTLSMCSLVAATCILVVFRRRLF